MNSDQNQDDASQESDISLSIDEEEYNRIYTNQLKKNQKLEQQTHKVHENKNKESQQVGNDSNNQSNESRSQRDQKIQSQGSRLKEKYPQPYIYDLCDSLVLDKSRFNDYILRLPIFKKKEEILNNIIKNQVVLITGETGCGKSTQVPRLLYEYIRETGLKAKIICVQPRRLAVRNLHKLLSDQIPEKGAVGYHIAMKTFMSDQTKILFMTNGIFLQRLVHGTQFFKDYPFIILDEVHERDIDTDFILLSMKRLIRWHPKARVILMSATIDNKLFQYYFADDQIDSFRGRQNFYKRGLRLEEAEKEKQRQQMSDGDFIVERVGENEQFYKKMQMQFLKSKCPCPTVNVTEKGKFQKQYFYLDTLQKYLGKQSNMKWGSVSFIHRSPCTSKQIFETACLLLQQISKRSAKNKSNQSVLMFLPGLGEIQYMSSQISTYFGKRLEDFQIIKCHSSILNDQVTKKMHHLYQNKIKVIIATNIAESSITVYGIKYIIDFCLSKEINFNQKSRMENLQLVWASKASCEQRAGRTGRVCNGIVFRLVQRSFYQKLPQYSTPQIQRSSLDRLILRIKLIHENEKDDNYNVNENDQNRKNEKIFEDPGEVLGTAIQPPNLKNIDGAIKSLIICGGLHKDGQKLLLTKLGRIYVDIPLDIIYSKMLLFSMLMGTYDDILILVCILSQNKNAFRKSAIEKNPLNYFEMMTNDQRCDYVALISAYKKQRDYIQKYQKDRSARPSIQLDIYNETNLLIQDVSRRIKQRNFMKRIYRNQTTKDHQQRFKFTIAFGFLSNLIKVRPMIYDDKQQKRYKLMKKQNISVKNTVVLLNSDVIRKSANQDEEADNRLKSTWIKNITDCFRLKEQQLSITLGHGISFLHFNEETQLNKLLFIKHLEDKRKRQGGDKKSSNDGSRDTVLDQILRRLGDIDYMQQGNPSSIFKDRNIYIDQYSSNRVVPVSKQNQSYQFPKHRLVITNNIIQQTNRLSCRFASLLPDIPNLQAIMHLVFYPFVSLLPDRKSTRYEHISIKNYRLHINYQLTDQEIKKANEIRDIIKELLSLQLFLEDEVNFDNIEPIFVTEDGKVIQDKTGEGVQECEQNLNKDSQMQVEKDAVLMRAKDYIIPANSGVKKQQTHASSRNEARIEKMKNFWPLLKQFILSGRKPIVQQQKWQQLYFKQKSISEQFSKIKHQKQSQNQYMNQIKMFDLRFSFFSSNFQSNVSREARIKQYEDWKLAKYKQVINLEILATDHDPYIVCSQCNLKIAKLNKIGPVNNQYFRQIFQCIQENISIQPFNQIGNLFCNMIITIYMEKQFDIYGCKNGHYLAVKFKDEKRLKIMTFSQISILYTDGTLQVDPQFHSMEFKKWRSRAEKSKINKMNRVEQNYCFVCGDKFKTVKEVEAHVKNQYHQANMRDFKLTIPEVARIKEQPRQQSTNATNAIVSY